MATYGPYSPSRQAGNLVFTAGHIGIDPKTKRAADDIESQTVQTLKNLKETLAKDGARLDDVIKVTVFLTRMDDFAAMNTAYERFFALPRPARSTVAVKELPRAAGDTKLLIEIEAVAAIEK